MGKPPRQKPGRSEQAVGTPPEFIEAVVRFLGIDRFDVDLAATPENACAFVFLTEEDDALDPGVSWVYPGGWNWLNPPFGKIGPWVRKASEQAALGAHTAVLIPASLGARWWIDHVVGNARIVPLDGRITFVGQTDPYPKDCALLLYGPDVEVGYAPAWQWRAELTAEERDMAKKRTAKPKKFKAITKARKAAERIAAARAGKPKVRQIADGRKKRKKKRTPPPEDPKPVMQAARVTTFKPNGAESKVIGPAIEELHLGAIVVPEPEDAQRVLRELAELNARALQAQKRYTDLKDATKTAKERYDDLAEQVLTRLRQTTHKSDLPLFSDLEQREADQATMEAAGETVSEQPSDAPTDSPSEAEASDLPEAGPEGPPPAPIEALQAASAVGDEIPDESIPF